VALSSTFRTPIDWRTAVPPLRPPLAAVIPGMDVVALGGAVLVAQLKTVGLLYGLAAFGVLTATGSHRARINPRLGDDLPWLLGRLTAPLIVVTPFAPDAEVGRFVSLMPIAVGLVVAGRWLSYAVVRAARARSFVQEPTLVVGAGTIGVRLARTLEDHPEYGLIPVGFLDSFEEPSELPILGPLEDLEIVVLRHRVRRVVVAFGAKREPELLEVLRACDRLPVEVHIVPRFFELGTAKASRFTDDVWGIPLVRLRRSALRTSAWRIKRLFDFVLANVALIVSTPVFLLAAVAMRLSSPGPVLFRQERIGQRGQPFQCLKLRTLREGTDAWTVPDDRRTRVGDILRRTGLDELPQLINVLRGEMSLVGPRPERPFFVDQFQQGIPCYADRHRVPVGITGWAQVNGLRGDTSIEERTVFDNHYIENGAGAGEQMREGRGGDVG
jgi:exopolysaccharide biosynthesis polyprenyl glycosylphosphotransferase